MPSTYYLSISTSLVEQIGCLNHDCFTQFKIQQGKGAQNLVFPLVFHVHCRSVPNWTSRLRSNVFRPDQSEQRFLYGQDKHLLFTTKTAYYTGLHCLLCEGCLRYSCAELRTENAKPSSYCSGRDFVDYSFLIYFFPQHSLSQHKAGINKQEEEICLYF